MADSLLAKAVDITGWSDDELALIIGKSAATARAYRLGTRIEYLDGKERKAVLDCVRLWLDQAEQEYFDLCAM